MAWQGADYLSPEWVADGWLPKQAVVIGAGAWVNHGYISRRYTGETWLHYIVTGAGATVAVTNVPGIALAVLPGSAKQIVHVNATTSAVPLAVFTASANASAKVTQANVPGIALVAFSGAVNGSIHQIADVTFTVEVASTFGYTKAVAQQNVAAVALAAIDAIVTTGSNVNVAATRVAVPLAALATTAKANSSTRAVSSVPTPLQVFDCEIAVGTVIDVLSLPFSVPLAVNPVAVAGISNAPTQVTATLAELPIEPLDTAVQAGRPAVVRGRSLRTRRGNRRMVVPARNRKLRA